MHVEELHDWNPDAAGARRLQEELAARVELRPLPEHVGLVAGADVAVSREAGLFFAAVVVLDFPALDVVEVRTAAAPATFPYVPGLLSFREGPAVVRAFRQLERVPDVVIFDGQGLAHPRRIGLACHMGLWLGLPTVGCAKSRLVGEHARPGRRKGRSVPLEYAGEQVGVVLRTRTDVKPVFVSPGHLADIPTSCRLVLDCCTRYRLPEPTRRAHAAVGRAKRERLSEVR